jgi:Ala-tRNA(Pro) deacylase
LNKIAYDNILKLLDNSGVAYAAFSHEPCKTSEESQAARASAGYPNVIGAKALLTKLYFQDGEKFATIVLPGTHVLDKDRLIAAIPGMKKMRFVTPEEMETLAGVVPGCMPPFASQIFKDIPVLIVASAMGEQSKIGFNAAFLEKSIVLEGKDYLSVVAPSFVVDCSHPKEA